MDQTRMSSGSNGDMSGGGSGYPKPAETKADVVSGNLLGTAFITALGLENGQRIRRILIDCVVGEPAIVTVWEMYPGMKASEVVSALKKYRIVSEEDYDRLSDAAIQETEAETDEGVFDDDDN